MEVEFDGEVIEWRGPAPFFFAALPEEVSEDLKEAARAIMYWGQIPVTASIGDTGFTTAMWPRDGRYLLPLKDAVRRAEGIVEGQVVSVWLRLGKDAPDRA